MEKLLEAESKPSEGKEKSSIKGSEGSLDSLNISIGKNNEFGKSSGASGNEAYSKSGDSGSEDSSKGSDANSQNDSPPKASDHQNSSDVGTPWNGNPTYTNTGDGSQNDMTRAPSQPVVGHTVSIIPVPEPAVPGAVATPSPILPIRGIIPSTAVPSTLVPGAPSILSMQDEKELKRQRRKQYNRESARRSRLRKQAECEELARRLEVLEEENASLRAELNQIKKDYEQLLTENTSLKESFGEIPMGIEELICDVNEKSCADDDHQQNLDSDGKGSEAV